MASAVDLLRLLEPTVRPAGLPGGATGPTEGKATGHSFEALLAEQTAAPQPPDFDDAQAPSSAQTSLGTPLAEAKPDGDSVSASPLAALAGIDRVENPALRLILG